MGNTDDKESEGTNTDIEIEQIDLNASSAENSYNKNIAAQTKSSLASRPLFLRRKSIRVTGAFLCFVIRVFILGSLSNAFSFVTMYLLHPDAVIQAPYNAINATPTVFQQDGLACTINTAWSPDSKRVAVLGYSNNCTLDHYQASLVNIYDVNTHKRLAQIHSDQTIISTFTKLYPGIKDKPVILYNHVSWSPDGSEMAFSFALSFPPNPAILNAIGILVITKQGKQTVLLRSLSKNDVPNVYGTWDLAQGISFQGNTLFPPFPPYLGFDLAPANAYSWKTDGFLIEQNEQFHSPVSPVGNPIGGTFFTPWQSGQVIGIPVAYGGKDRYMWQTSFATWSPDGRYYTDIYTGAQLLPIGQSSNQQSPGKQGSNQMPTLIMHDRALEHLILLYAIVHKPFTLPILSWRPDGHELAVYNNGQINLYDCVSGKRVRSLSPLKSTPVGLLEGTDTMSWSPNGKYLLLSSSIWGVMTLWRPDQLSVR